MTEQQLNALPQLIDEWPVRQRLLSAILDVFADGIPKTSLEIRLALENRRVQAGLSMINSVLFSEGRRYVAYDRKSFRYHLRTSDEVRSRVHSNDVKFPEDSRGESDETPLGIQVYFAGTNQEFVFTSLRTGGPAFFEVRVKGNMIVIDLNGSHLLFDLLQQTLDSSEPATHQELAGQVDVARRCVEMLIVSWARMEYQQPLGVRLNRVRDIRADWGRVVSELMSEEADDDVR